MQLSPKENSLLKDLTGQEKLCIEKYSKNACMAKDSQLKDLFNHLSQNEQQHLNMLTQIQNGTVPQVPQGIAQTKSQTFNSVYTSYESEDKKNDCYLCSDVLAAEKHASALYDTSIFEFKDEKVRNVLNHIQKDEQEHGKKIYDYMSANGMYN